MSAKTDILVIGLGYFGRRIAQTLCDHDENVMVVDSVEERVQDCLPFAVNGRIGDTTDPDFVQSLAPQDYDVCIVAIGDDFMSSLQTTSLLKEAGAKLVVSRASDDVQEKFLLRNGADKVVFPERSAADWTAVCYGDQNVFDYLPVGDGYVVMEVAVPRGWVGKCLARLNIRHEFGVNVIALMEGKAMNPNVDPARPLEEDDVLVVLGKLEDIRRCFRL